MMKEMFISLVVVTPCMTVGCSRSQSTDSEVEEVVQSVCLSCLGVPEEWLDREITFQEAEAESATPTSQGLGENWNHFKTHVQPDDKLYVYDNRLFHKEMGRRGYAIVRDGEVVYAFQTRMN